MSKSKILFQISGSIAAFKSAAVVSQLIKDGMDVKVVFSQNAHRFVGASTFEGLTGHPVHSDVFDARAPMAHIDLARWADLIVLCPASANTIAQLAHGFAFDLIGNLFLARELNVPYVIFPAMNTKMWNAPTVHSNLKALKDIAHVHVIEPAKGVLACGEEGEGRLPEPTEILNHISNFLKFERNNHPSILITGGGTSEPIDSVRSITNFSTGKTSVGLAEHLQKSGFDVELLLANSAVVEPPKNLSTKRFSSHQDLQQLLKTQLAQNKYKAVIHLAAVSDYALENPQVGKISSAKQNLHLNLVPTSKIVDQLKSWSLNQEAKIIAFKLTSGSETQSRLNQGKDLMQRNGLDGVVVNDLTDIASGHAGVFLKPDQSQISFQTKSELYKTLENFLKEDL